MDVPDVAAGAGEGGDAVSGWRSGKASGRQSTEIGQCRAGGSHRANTCGDEGPFWH